MDSNIEYLLQLHDTAFILAGDLNKLNCSHQMPDFKAKIWGAYSAPPEPLAGFKGAYF